MASQPVVFSTQTRYVLPSSKFMIPADWKRFQLSQLVNKALSLSKPIPFDFLVRGKLLGSRSLGEWCSENNVGEEETLDIEYIESVLPPQKVSDFEHDDWVSSVSCHLNGHFLTGSYDGHLRAFDFSRNRVIDAPLHAAPITSVALVQSSSSSDEFTVASASQDTTAKITRVYRSSENGPFEATTDASLHLHTAPLASVASNSSGSHLLTASWDSLIGLWDTKIPESDEVAETLTSRSSTKRRKLSKKDDDNVKRKAPLTVLKSHTSRVSAAVFSKDGQKAFSCGFDSSVRIWDAENGLCIQTIMAAEKPFLDLALTSDENTIIGASTDRIVTAYDIRSPSDATSQSSVSLLHPSTPSCLASVNSPFKVISGSYDGVARLWDLRNTKGTVASFKVWDGTKKILSVDWNDGMVGVGGEGGLEVWKIPESTS